MSKKVLKKSLVVSNTETNVNEEKGIVTISGYANKYLNQEGEVIIDRSDESVIPTAYKLDYYLKNPVVLFQHDLNRPVGKATKVELRQEGLYVEVEVYRDVDSSVYNAVKNGVLRAFSIGFSAYDYKFIPEKDLWVWTDIVLNEVSIVSVPDNQESLFVVTGVKGLNCPDGKCLLASKADKSENIEKSLEDVNDIKKDLGNIIENVVEDTTSSGDNSNGDNSNGDNSNGDNSNGDNSDKKEQDDSKKDPKKDELPQDISLHEATDFIIDNVNPDNFNSLYDFYIELGEKLNNLLKETIGE